MNVRRLHELLAELDGVDPDSRIEWEHVGPAECCPGHFHDITLTVGHEADVVVGGGVVTVVLSGGHA